MLSKQVSFIVDQQGVRKAAVVPIDIFNELVALQKALSDSKPGQRERYHFAANGAEASGYPVGPRHKPGFLVLQGSSVNTALAGSLRPAVVELCTQLQAKGVLVSEGARLRFVADQVFHSPSLAASLIAGNNRSGLDAWRNGAGFTLKQSGYGKPTS